MIYKAPKSRKESGRRVRSIWFSTPE